MITLLWMEIAVEPGWAVGAVPLDDPALDRDLLTDHQGRPWVPGSSLAGSLRAHLRAHDEIAGTTLETHLMGSRPPQHHDDTADPSPLWILGTRFTPDVDPGPSTPGGEHPAAVEIVGQTAIDRTRGAATATTLRYSRAVASGGNLTAFLRYDGELTDTERAALASWNPTIGRDRTTGSGRARLSALRFGVIDPTTPGGRQLWLTHTGESLVRAVATTEIPGVTCTDQAWLTADLVIEDALLVGDPRPTGPARPRMRGGRPLVPGSTWKGVFRARVEYILRSLYGDQAVCHGPEGCGNCPVCEVFGHRHRRGLLVFADSVVDTRDAPGAPPGSSPRTQVGIDRVTGGACDGLLFECEPVTAGRLQLRIDLLGAVDEWVRPAIKHVLRDLHDGVIGVGSRVTRGMGTLRLATDPPAPGPLRVPALENDLRGGGV